MRATVDPDGRITLPDEVRRDAGIAPGVVLDVRCYGRRIELEPAEMPVRLERRGALVVAVPDVPAEPLTAEVVNDVLEEVRRERQGL